MTLPKIAFVLGIVLMTGGLLLMLNATYAWLPLPGGYPFATGMGLTFGGMLLWGWGRYRLKGDRFE